jgi:hypothetical protein
LADFDYWHEKVALTKYAHDLVADGWEVGLSVKAARLDDEEPLGGEHPRPLDGEFENSFNAAPIPGVTAFRYKFYRDTPGNIDLVARRDGAMLVVEGKGRSATNRRGAVAQMVGAHMLERRPGRSDIRYAILLPGGDSATAANSERAEIARWNRALRNHGDLQWIEVYRISRKDGTVVRGEWPPAELGVE